MNRTVKGILANGDNYAAAPLIINIASDLNLTVSVAAMSVTAYMLSFGVFTLIFGPLSDRYGKVKIINIAAIGTAVFSMLGAFAFIFLQSTLITAVQEKLPKMRGTAMSLASFNMFVGGAIGTSVYAVVMQNTGLASIYFYSAFILFFISMVAAVFIARFEMRKQQVSNYEI